MRTPKYNLIVASVIFSLAATAVAQTPPVATPGQSNIPVRPAVAFPPTPTPAPKAEPMTEAQLDEFLIPSNYLARTSDVVSIIYNGFRRSQIDPCGCVTHQLGGLDKEARLVNRIEDLEIPTLEVDAGGWVRDMPDEKLLTQSQALLKGLGEIGYDAVNVAFTELAMAPDELKKLAADAKVSLLSANITDTAGQPVFDPYVIKPVTMVDGTEVKVGVIGVTRSRIEMSANSLDAPTSVTAGNGTGAGIALQITDPITAINRYAAELKGQADFIIVMDYDRRSNAQKIIGGLADKSAVDLLIMGENTQIQGSLQTLEGVHVVSGGYEGRQLGTLYLELKDGNVVSTYNRHVEVLQTIPPVQGVTELIEQTHKVLEQPGDAASNEPQQLQL